MTSVDRAAAAVAPTHVPSRPRRRRTPLADTLTYLVLFAGALITLAPFALSFMTAFKTPLQFASQPALSVPNPVTTENFTRLFSGDYGFVSPVAVTAQVVVVILVGQLVFSIMAAYAFAKLRFAGRDALFWVYLATLMIPQVVIVIPLYTMMVQIGMRNTFWALVLPFMFGSPYAVFLLREHFRSIPDDLIDAARIDGAGDWRILWQIVAPLSRGIISTLAIITIVAHWNNFMFGSPYAVFLLREHFRSIPDDLIDAARIDGAGDWRILWQIVAPLSRGIISTLAIITIVAHWNNFMWPLIITTGQDWQVITVATANLQSQYNANWTLVMAATTMAMAPLLLLFALFQRTIVESISLTGFK